MVTLLAEAATVDPVASTLPGAAVLLGLGAYKIATTVIEKRRNGNGKAEQRQLCFECRDRIRDTNQTVSRLELMEKEAIELARAHEKEHTQALRENGVLLRDILAQLRKNGAR